MASSSAIPVNALDLTDLPHDARSKRLAELLLEVARSLNPEVAEALPRSL